MNIAANYNTYQPREAKRLGLERALDRATDSKFQKKMRELRAENQRRHDNANS